MSDWLDDWDDAPLTAEQEAEWDARRLADITAELADRERLWAKEQELLLRVNRGRSPYVAKHPGCVPCFHCQGIGTVEEDAGFTGGVMAAIYCPRCGGTGLKE